MLPRTTLLAFVAGAAIAAGGSSSAVLVATAAHGGTPSPHPTVSHGADENEAPETEEPDAEEHASTATPPPCPADVKNHGAYVSSVAKSGAGEDVVAAAAQSDCGKPSHDENGQAGKHGSGSHGRSGDAPGHQFDHPNKDDHPSGDEHPSGESHPTGASTFSH